VIATLALLLCLAATPLSQPDVDMILTPPDAEVGLLMELQLVVKGEEAVDTALKEIPEVDGARVSVISGPETISRTVRVNGRRTDSITATWRLELVPERAGELRIPPIRFESRGRDLYSEELNVLVGPDRVPPGTLELELRPSVTEVYVGQIVELDLSAQITEDYFDRKLSRNGLQLEIPWLDELQGFHRKSSDVPGATGTIDVLPSGAKLPFRVQRESRGGVDRIVLSTRVPLLASSPGEYTLRPSRLRMRVAVEVRTDRDIFNRAQYYATRVLEPEVLSDALTLRVKPTPLAGRPTDYLDAVGAFDLNGDVSPRDVAVGESARLQLVITRKQGRPEGNLELLEWPDFEEQLADFRVFGKEEFKQPDRRVLVLEISPRRADVTGVPELSLASFDPLEERYVRASTGPFPMRVEGGVDLELPSLSSAQDRGSDLDSIRVTLSPERDELPWWWLMPVAGALVLLGVDLSERRKHWRASHGGELRKRGARRQLDESLSAASDAAGVASAFARFLSARVGGPEAGLTREEAQRELSARGHGELANELGRVLEGWELAYLGGGRLDVDAAREQARELARRVEALT